MDICYMQVWNCAESRSQTAVMVLYVYVAFPLCIVGKGDLRATEKNKTTKMLCCNKTTRVFWFFFFFFFPFIFFFFFFFLCALACFPLQLCRIWCVQSSSCLQGRTLHLYSDSIRPPFLCQDPRLFSICLRGMKWMVQMFPDTCQHYMI